ncbi:YcfA-like family protein [Bifidobacterium lemurum]|uniref:YcfA-like family protein n=1 Tax=Bifidobacterium lemurum TaxID=1603886 RepID=A0A261FSX5_9BIFI|nr:hypothetical protein [Bifidobacterium lemurum]OZG62291.1 YcfA-like family protein [Bifidobacterium lemurum]QOL33657.1 hypothetical protein BL8807_07615 [Bifidobacterium lemurum]
MTKRKTLIRALRRAARARGMEFILARQGANHEVYKLGGLMIPIPRHTEIDDRLADRICDEAEAKLGKGWKRP